MTTFEKDQHQIDSNPAEHPVKVTFLQKLLLVVCSILLVLVLGELGIRTRDTLFKGRGFFTNERNILLNYRSPKPFRTFGPNLYNERSRARH